MSGRPPEAKWLLVLNLGKMYLKPEKYFMVASGDDYNLKQSLLTNKNLFYWLP